MKDHIEECKKCGNYVEGKVQRTEEQKLTRAATSKGISGCVTTLLGGGLGTMIFPVLGTAIGSVIGWYIGYLINEKYGKEIADSLEDSLFEESKFEFVCPKCGNRWTRIFKTTTDTTPIELLQREKDDDLKSSKDSLRACVCGSIFFILITIACFSYCYINDATYMTTEDVWLIGPSQVTNYNYLWFFIAFLFVVFLICTYFPLSGLFSAIKDINALEKMDLEDFRNSELRKTYKNNGCR